MAAGCYVSSSGRKLAIYYVLRCLLDSVCWASRIWLRPATGTARRTSMVSVSFSNPSISVMPSSQLHDKRNT